MLAASLRQDAAQLASRFNSATPFRHWVIDQFFTPAAADQLLREFPSFERGNARNEQGELGGKSVVEQIRDLGPGYAALDDLVKSQAFLDWLGAATGIPDLRYDPWYFGGGTHDNRHGQELDPHIDFNRHPKTQQHRRLNLIIYLNPEWDDHWGGALELHSDPRRDDDQVTLISPQFNRAVLFETTEWSWHGFGKIDLPESKRQLSRRSIALYFYTEQRPTEELAPSHSTVYVDRPLPERYAPGLTLSEQDVQELKVMLARRDQHNQRLYGDLIHAESRIEQLLAERQSLARAGLNALRGLWRYARSERRADDRQALLRASRPLASRVPQSLRRLIRKLIEGSPSSGL